MVVHSSAAALATAVAGAPLSYSNAMIALIRVLALLALALGLNGCAGLGPPALQPGVTSAREIRERLGAPAAEWPNSDGSVSWEYPTGPAGTRCWMLTLSADGMLQKTEQVLTEENFARIEKGWHTGQVRRLLGKPAGIDEFPRMPEIVWEWRVQPMIPGQIAFFHVHFSPDGIVTRTSRREETPEDFYSLWFGFPRGMLTPH